MTINAGVISRVYWRLLRLFGFGKNAWDEQFRRGIWTRDRHSDLFIEKVVALSRGGLIVEFGCAEGGLIEELPKGSYSNYQGYDISGVAVGVATDRAKKSGLTNCLFQQCDMSQWTGCSDASLILLEECLYYLSVPQIKVFLETCKNSLRPAGVILVIVHSADKHARTLEACRASCHVVEEVMINGRVFLTLGTTTG